MYVTHVEYYNFDESQIRITYFSICVTIGMYEYLLNFYFKILLICSSSKSNIRHHWLGACHILRTIFLEGFALRSILEQKSRWDVNLSSTIFYSTWYAISQIIQNLNYTLGKFRVLFDSERKSYSSTYVFASPTFKISQFSTHFIVAKHYITYPFIRNVLDSANCNHLRFWGGGGRNL